MSTSVLRSCVRQVPFTPKTWSQRILVSPKTLSKSISYRQHSTQTAAPLSTPSSSVSQDEVSHFTQLASTWWDPYGPSRLLHLMNPLRHDFIQTCFQSSTSPNNDGQKYTYLDIGCGGGIFASSAARLPSTESVTAIDPTLSVIQVAKAKQRTDPAIQEPQLTYLNCAVENLQSHLQQQEQHRQKSAQEQKEEQQEEGDEKLKQYDIVTMFEVIEHISKPSEFLTQALQHLKPRGWLIGSTISRHPISYLTTKLIAEAPVIGIVPSGTHNWNQYINPDELIGWFAGQDSHQNHLHDRLHDHPKTQDEKQITAATWGDVQIQGVIYVPVLGWKFVTGSERYGNYFFGVQKLEKRLK